MKDFQWIYDRAAELKGEENLTHLMPHVASEKTLISTPDDRYLSTMCQRIFRAGLKHSVVDAKWPDFETSYMGFHPKALAGLSDEELEAIMVGPNLIKHWGKTKAIRHNAQWVLAISAEYDGFGRFVADWPVTDIVSLWGVMKKQAAQLGGRSGSAFLRMAGKDTFMLSQDVMVQLRALGVVPTVESTTAKRDLNSIQDAFNQWHDQSGLPMAHISRLLSFT